MKRYFASGNNRSIFLLVFSLLGVLVLLGRAAYLLVDLLIRTRVSAPIQISPAPSVLDALSMLLCAGLILPLIRDCIRQLQGKELRTARLPVLKFNQILLLVVAWTFLLTVSSLLTLIPGFGWLIAAPAFLLGILLPVAGLAWVSAGGLVTSGTRRRLWAAFSLGMTGGTGLALFFEYLLLGIVVAIGALAVLINPELGALLKNIQTLAEGALTTEELLTRLAPTLTNPWVVLGVLAMASGFGPLIEEAVKPLAVWLLGKRLRSKAEGFVLGALSGAGFALLEGLMSASGMAETPYFGLPARLASSLMHITLSGLMGWGIAGLMLEKRWKRFVGIYALSTLLHGLWNGSALLAVYGSLRFVNQGMTYDLLSILCLLAGIALLGLVFLAIATGLPLINQRLRRAQDDIIAPLASQPERNPDGLDSQSS
jgi:RsiW-degrading membrane proteinase PrsW (M82 family)